MELAGPSTARDGSAASSPLVDEEIAPDTLSDGTVPRAPLLLGQTALPALDKTAPLARPIRVATGPTLIERLLPPPPPTCAVFDPPQPQPQPPQPPQPPHPPQAQPRAPALITHNASNAGARRWVGVAAACVAAACALSIAFMASRSPGSVSDTPSRVETTSASLEVPFRFTAPQPGPPVELSPLATADLALTPAAPLRPVQRQPAPPHPTSPLQHTR